MFRCHSIIWVSLIWSLIFSYTLMTHLGTTHMARTSVLATAAGLILVGASILVYENVMPSVKTLLWFATWSFFILLGLIFFTEGFFGFNDVTLNLWVTSFTLLASIFWCVVSHTNKITEPGLHWYIWCLISIVAVSSAFNNTSSTAITIHIIMCVLLTVVNISYLVYIFRVQSPNDQRCRQIWRVGSCAVVSIGFIIGSILYKTEVLSPNTWSEYIMVTQGLAFALIVVDSVVGFSQKYQELPGMPEDDNDENRV